MVDLTDISGKTFLVSMLVEELKKRQKQARPSHGIPPDSNIYYFYCHEDDEQNRTCLGVLKGILMQMVERVDYVLPLCEEKLSDAGGESLSSVEVAQSLVETFIEYGPRQYIVIDGLDECANGEARQIADFFMGQVSKCDNHVAQGQLRVLFMSQTMRELRRHLPEDDASISLKPGGNAADIRAYVHSRINEFSDVGECGFNLTEIERLNIENVVCQQSKGERVAPCEPVQIGTDKVSQICFCLPILPWNTFSSRVPKRRYLKSHRKR